MRVPGLFRTLEISASGLAVQRVKLDTAAENLANVETTKTENGEPYRRKRVVIKAIENREALKAWYRDSESLNERAELFRRILEIEIGESRPYFP